MTKCCCEGMKVCHAVINRLLSHQILWDSFMTVGMNYFSDIAISY